MSTIFGTQAPRSQTPAAGGYLGGGPELPNRPPLSRVEQETPLLRWCRETRAELKRERQAVTEEMKRNVNLARGGTPWWRNPPKWKIKTKLNYCATVPLTWTAILCDAKPTVTYTALDKSKQKRADIASAAYKQASTEGRWDQVIHDAELVAQVQKVGYLSLRPKMYGDQIKPDLRLFLGEQVWVEQNARSPQDSETTLCEYYESYGSLCARFKGLREKLHRKYGPRTEEDSHGRKSVMSGPASYSFGGLSNAASPPATSGGSAASGTVTTPAYAASPNAPTGSGGTGGLKVEEFWTQPRRTIEVEEVQFLTSGEPATEQKYYETIEEEDSEPLRRIVTEGNIIYELPESLVNALEDAQDNEGIKILSNQPALEAVTHTIEYLVYPQGRLVVVVDDDVIPDDRMNPLGYIPFIKVQASSDPGGGYYGMSSVDLIADVYEQLVRCVSLVYDNANLMGNSMWRVWEGEPATNDDFTNAPGGILRETIQSLRFSKRESAPELPNYIPAYIKFLIEQIKELSGLSEVMTGKMPPKQQISTETETMRQEASGVRFRDAQSFLADATRILGEHFLEFMARFYTSPVIVQIKNNAGVHESIPVLGSYFTDPLVVEAKAGSSQPAGPSQRLQTLLGLRNVGVPLPLQTVYDLLEELNAIPSATAAMREVERLKMNPAEAWKLLMPPQGKPQQAKKPGSKRQRKGAGVGAA